MNENDDVVDIQVCPSDAAEHVHKTIERVLDRQLPQQVTKVYACDYTTRDGAGVQELFSRMFGEEGDVTIIQMCGVRRSV